MASGSSRSRIWVATVVAVAVMAGAAGGATGESSESMSAERTGEAMEAYLAALTSEGAFADHFANDIVVTLVDDVEPGLGASEGLSFEDGSVITLFTFDEILRASQGESEL